MQVDHFFNFFLQKYVFLHFKYFHWPSTVTQSFLHKNILLHSTVFHLQNLFSHQRLQSSFKLPILNHSLWVCN